MRTSAIILAVLYITMISLAVGLSLVPANRFELLTSSTVTWFAVANWVAGFALTGVFGRLYSGPNLVRWAVAGAIASLLMVDVVTSAMRHEIIIAASPTLFIVPGSIIGASLGSYAKERSLSRSVEHST